MPERKRVWKPWQRDHPDPSKPETDTADYDANICVYRYPSENTRGCVKTSLLSRTKMIPIADYWCWFYHFILDGTEMPSIKSKPSNSDQVAILTLSLSLLETTNN